MRSADGVGDHHTQRDAGVPEQGGSDGGMTVQVEIVLHGRCDLRACELRAFRIVAARGAAGFLGGEIALVEGHLAGRTDIDIDAPALALRSLLIFPIMEMIGRGRSEEHTSEPQSLMRISYAVFCLKKKK